MSKKVLIFYSEINMYEQTRAGGLEHLLANITGYTQNGYKIFVVGSYNKKLIEKDKNGNIYFNIIYTPQRKSISLKNNSENNNANIQVKVFGIKQGIKILIDSIYQFIVFLLVFFLNINIFHERSTKRFKKLWLIKKIFSNKKYFYEMNDELFNHKSLSFSDINLVVDDEFFPKGYKYFSSPWPVNFQNPQVNIDRYDNRVVYLGSIMNWHGFDKMIEIVKSLGGKWKIDVYGPDIANDVLSELDDRIVFKGFLENGNISKVLSKYKFGFAIYNNIYGDDRNKVGSPMKVAHYLHNNVIPITNMVNDEKLQEEYNIIDINHMTIENILRSNQDYNFSNFSSKYLDSVYNPKNYISKILRGVYIEK
jgi:hypothetical protein